MLRLIATRAQIEGTVANMNEPIHNPYSPSGSHRKHTPIMSQKQRGLFGAELSRRKRGLTPRMKGITTKELESHLHESKGKKLPRKAK